MLNNPLPKELTRLMQRVRVNQEVLSKINFLALHLESNLQTSQKLLIEEYNHAIVKKYMELWRTNLPTSDLLVEVIQWLGGVDFPRKIGPDVFSRFDLSGNPHTYYALKDDKSNESTWIELKL